jgi:hypothetical protein
MMRLLLIVIWFLTGSVVLNVQQPRPVFGVRVAFQANSEITTFVCFMDEGYAFTHKRILNKTEFIQIASGKWPSMYNPKRINHFAEHNLDCGMYRDSFSIKEYPVCVPFDSLWKLRFSTYPFKSSLESGWSSKMYRPSEKQELFLYNNYNIRSIDENFFLDTSFWKLLSDIQDPIWIANYKSLK